MNREMADHLLQSLQLHGLGGRMVDLEDPYLLHARDTICSRIESGAQDDDLVKSLLQARF